MPTEILAPSRLNKSGAVWRDDRPFAEALTAAVNQFWLKYDGILPVSVYCGEPIPEDFEGDGVPVWYDHTFEEGYFWLEYPEGMDGRRT